MAHGRRQLETGGSLLGSRIGSRKVCKVYAYTVLWKVRAYIWRRLAERLINLPRRLEGGGAPQLAFPP